MMVVATASRATGSLLANTMFMVTASLLIGPCPSMPWMASMSVRSGTRQATWSTISERMSWCIPYLALPPAPKLPPLFHSGIGPVPMPRFLSAPV